HLTFWDPADRPALSLDSVRLRCTCGGPLMLKRILVLLAVLCDLGAFQNRAAAQERGSWAFDFEPMWMNVKGFDQHAGDVVRTTNVLTTTPLRLTDTRTREPIMN